MRRLILPLALSVALTVAGIARAQAPQRSPPPRATHWCRGGDPPLHVSRRTTCGLAAALVNRLFNGPRLGIGRSRTISVRARGTHRSYRLRLTRRGDFVTATGPDGIWIRFYYDG